MSLSPEAPALDLHTLSPEEVTDVHDRSDDLSAPADLFVGPLMVPFPRIPEKDWTHAERASAAPLLAASITHIDARAGIDPQLLRDREVVALMWLPRPEYARELNRTGQVRVSIRPSAIHANRSCNVQSD